MVVFFAFFPIALSSLRRKEKSKRLKEDFCVEEIFDDEEL